jgi:hypothetical protein
MTREGDDFMREHGGQVNLVGFSPEGSGLMVLSGMTSIISRDHPDILFEILPNAPIQEIDRVLDAARYRVFAIDEGARRLIPLDRLEDCAGEGMRTYLVYGTQRHRCARLASNAVTKCC